MSRVAPRKDIQEAGLGPLFAKGKEIMGFETMDGLIMAHQPEMLKASTSMIISVLQKGTVDPGLKRLMGYICSTASGCTYCSAHTNYTARFYDVDEQKMKEVWDYESSELFADAEKAAIHLAKQSSSFPNETTDEDFERLRLHFSEEEIVELVFTISAYAFLNRFNSTMQTSLEDAPKVAFEKMKKK